MKSPYAFAALFLRYARTSVFETGFVAKGSPSPKNRSCIAEMSNPQKARRPLSTSVGDQGAGEIPRGLRVASTMGRRR